MISSDQDTLQQVKNLMINENLYWFYRNYISSNFKENLNAPHIETLAAYLTDLKEGNINRLCVAMPPRHSKSSMVTLAFPLWLLSKDKDLNILIVNNSANLSEKFGIQLREYVRRIGPIFDLYLSDVKHSSTYLMFTDKQGRLQNGSIRLVGANGSITGQDADYVILDDIYSGFEDITPSLLEKKIDWFKTIIEQRIEPHTKLVILHTRWHTKDLQGYLKENFPDDYSFVEFPAINKEGKPLWNQRYTIEDYNKKLESMGNRLFQAIYQQNPLDLTSNFFYTDNIIWEKDIDTRYHIATCRSWDMAYTEANNINSKKADYTAGVNAYKISENHYIFTDFIHGQYGKENIRKIQNTAYLDGLNKTILIETGTKGAAAKELFNVWNNDYLSQYKCKQSLPWGTKADRAQALADAMYDGKVHFCIYDDDLRKTVIQQFKAFPNSADHDDIVDACSYAFLFLKDKGVSQIVTGGKRRRRNRL